MRGSDVGTVATITRMTVVTVLTRARFFLPERPWPLPHWLEAGFRYAPIAALAAVVLPEILTTDGHLITTWRDARVFAAAIASAWFLARRGLLGTIVVGMAAYLPLHLGLGW